MIILYFFIQKYIKLYNIRGGILSGRWQGLSSDHSSTSRNRPTSSHLLPSA
jgi:hypothetical protein